MSEREPDMDQEQGPLTGTAALELKRKQLLEAGELQEPDITGAEAVELITRCSQMGVALSREDLKGRALRLTGDELDHIVDGGDWLKWFRGDWRKSFVTHGGVVSTTERITAEYTILFPDELGPEAEFREAKQVEQTWINRADIPSIQPLFKGIKDEVEQRRMLLEFMRQ